MDVNYDLGLMEQNGNFVHTVHMKVFYQQDEWAKVSSMASWWPPHIYQSKSRRNLRISEFRKNSCRPHLHIIAPSTTLRSLTTNSVFLCMWTQGTLQIRSGKFFLLQTSIPNFSSPPPPWSGVWRPLKSHYHWRSHRRSGTDVRQSGKSQKPCFPS